MGPGGQRRQTLTMDEFLDDVVGGGLLRGCGAISTGPRVHGERDEEWESDVQSFRTARVTAEKRQDASAEATSPLVLALACTEDLAMRFRPGADEAALAWFCTTFKRAYQETRVPEKRPWPEFAASVRTRVGFTRADLAALSISADLNAGTVQDGALIVTPRLEDAGFESAVMDVRTCLETTLGHLCAEAMERVSPGRAAPHRRHVSSALAMSPSTRVDVWNSRIASRQSALDVYVRDIGRELILSAECKR